MKDSFAMCRNSEIFEHFWEISKIPRGSGYEKAVGDYVLRYAEGLGLEAWKDEAHNVVVRKPASKGREEDPAVMIQGHLDMVWDKTVESSHCFQTDPIEVIQDEDWLHADGTTLGGDDGIAIAYAMTLMADTEHSFPALEFVLTSGEEIGLLGAKALDKSRLRAKYMINLDSERENEVLSSCAGGVQLNLEKKVQRQGSTEGDIPVLVRIHGLRGGHSGDDIDKNRGNAISLMGEFLFKWYNYEQNTHLVSMEGGSKENAIPRECTAKIWIPEEKRENLNRGTWWFGEDLNRRYNASDPNVRIEVSYPDPGAIDPADWDVIMDEDHGQILSFLNLAPNGVINMSKTVDGLVETSCNMGVVNTEADSWQAVVSLRSSDESKKELLRSRFEILAEMNGIAMTASGDYPGWTYTIRSPLRELYLDTYKKLFHQTAKASAIHAGVECGLFVSAMDGLDAISVGPDMQNTHSPQERLSISSAERVFQVLLAVLERLH